MSGYTRLNPCTGIEHGNLTKSSAVSSVEAAYYTKNGHVVNFYIMCTCNNITSSTETLFTGLPHVYNSSMRFIGMIVASAASSSDNGKAFRFSVNTNGVLQNAYDNKIMGSSGIQLQMCGTYISSE